MTIINGFNTFSVNVTVVDCTNTIPLYATLQSGGQTDEGLWFGIGNPTIFTSGHESQYASVGIWLNPNPPPPGLRGFGAALQGGTTTTAPFAYRSQAGPNPLEVVYWNGTSGLTTSIAMPGNASSQGIGTFMDNGSFLVVVPGAGGADVWGVAFGGTTLTRLTNLGGSALGVAASPDNFMYLDFHQGANGSHIYRLPIPAIGSTPVTSGLVQMTTNASLNETQPAVSQNGRLLAFAQYNNMSTAQIMVIPTATPGAMPTLISPATGFAFTPSWCGNEFIYYAYSTSYNGPYQLMKWNAALNTSSPVAAFSGLTLFDVAVARTDGDGVIDHVCP